MGIVMQKNHLNDASDTWHYLRNHGLVLICLEQQNGYQMDEQAMVVFRLGNACYGVPKHAVCAIQTLGPYTPLPFARPGVVGAVTVQGRLVGVMDICPLIGKEKTVPGPDSLLVVVKLDNMEMGLLADEIVNTEDTYQ